MEHEEDEELHVPEGYRDLVTKVSAAKEQQILSLHDDPDAAPLFGPWAKFAVCVALLGVIALVIWKCVLSLSAPSTSKPQPEAPTEVVTGVTSPSPSPSGLTTSAQLKPDQMPIVGQRALAGEISIDVFDLATLGASEKGAMLMALTAFIGNGGKAPLLAPAVEVWLLDSDGRRYQSHKQTGPYQKGMLLNPLLTQEQTCAFLVPAEASMVSAEFKIAGGKTAMVDIRERTEENRNAVLAENYARRAAEIQRFLQLIADDQNKQKAKAGSARTALDEQIAAAQLAADQVRQQHAAARQEADELATQFDQAKRIADRADRKEKNAAAGLEKEKADYAKVKDQRTNAAAVVHDLENAPPTTRRGETLLAGQLARARQDQARLEHDEGVAEKDQQAKAKALTDAQAEARDARTKLAALDLLLTQKRKAVADLDTRVKSADAKVLELQKQGAPVQAP